MKSWTLAALDLLYPALCPLCEVVLDDDRRDPLCGACFAALPRLAPPWCARCGAALTALGGLAPATCGACVVEPPPWQWARAAARYAGPLREAVHALKFHGRRALAVPLADLIVEQCGPAVPADVDALVAVPLAAARERERGFNQAALIAERAARTLGLSARPRWLRRARPTRPQSELGSDERRANVRGAFSAPAAVAGRHVVVVDDVLTTGATAAECARALHDAGAREVGVLTVARVEPVTL